MLIVVHEALCVSIHIVCIIKHVKIWGPVCAKASFPVEYQTIIVHLFRTYYLVSHLTYCVLFRFQYLQNKDTRKEIFIIMIQFKLNIIQKRQKENDSMLSDCTRDFSFPIDKIFCFFWKERFTKCLSRTIRIMNRTKVRHSDFKSINVS